MKEASQIPCSTRASELPEGAWFGDNKEEEQRQEPGGVGVGASMLLGSRKAIQSFRFAPRRPSAERKDSRTTFGRAERCARRFVLRFAQEERKKSGYWWRFARLPTFRDDEPLQRASSLGPRSLSRRWGTRVCGEMKNQVSVKSGITRKSSELGDGRFLESIDAVGARTFSEGRSRSLRDV